jgi:hypothetical protein
MILSKFFFFSVTQFPPESEKKMIGLEFLLVLGHGTCTKKDGRTSEWCDPGLLRKTQGKGTRVESETVD